MNSTDTTTLDGASTSTLVDVLIYLFVSLVPLLLAGPQLVVGIIVNACLFLAAENWTVKKSALLAVLPSVAAILHGVILGGFTPFLVYLAPFIWLGNAVLMMVYRWLKDKSAGMAIGLAAGLKALLLFSVACLMVKQQILPSPFLLAMGVVQLVTALLGGGVVKLAHRFLSK